MPVHEQIYTKGHLFIVFEVEFPHDGYFDKEACKKLAHLLPLPKISKKEEKHNELDEYFVEDLTPAEKKQGQTQSKEAYEEDDDEGQGRGYACKPQ